eukprot:gene7783-8427_t
MRSGATPYVVVWARSAASVEEEVRAALVMVVLFAALVLGVDAALAAAEIVMLARPLAALAARMRGVETMRLDLAPPRRRRLREVAAIEAAFGSMVARLH